MDVLADKYIIGLYQDLERDVIADIARRVKKTGRYTETAELMARSMHELGYSPAKIQSEVMKMLRADKAYQKAVAEETRAYKQEIQDLIDAMVKEAKESGNALIAEAGNMAWNNDMSMWEEHGVSLKKPNTMSQLILAFQKQTVGELKNLTRSMGFKNTVLGTTGIMNAYQREMDLALLKVATGTFSFDQAVNDCIHRLAQSGLRSIDYANGKSYQLDTAARMSVRTGMSQLAGRVMEENLNSTGHDLVITSQHMGSRPEHANWQNKVFSFSGKNKKYPDFRKSTGYGTVTGLKGANCSHDYYPYWEGASVIPPDIKEPDPVTVNGKEYDYYQATQQQRKMERNIRATKREIEAQKAIGGDTSALNARLRKQSAEYKQFSNAVGLRPKNNRLGIKTGTSALRGTNTYRKFVSASRENAIDGSKVITAQSRNRRLREKEIIERGILLDKPIFDDGKLNLAYRQRAVEGKGEYYDIVGHGSPDIIEFFGQSISDETLKKILNGREDYTGQKIRLISCSTGLADEDGNCFAQRLADTMGVEVVAPNGLLNIHIDGKITIGVNPYKNTGEMITFKPRRRSK